MASKITVKFRKGNRTGTAEGRRVLFSPFRAFRFDGHPDEVQALTLLADHLQQQRGLAFYGSGPLLQALFDHRPALVHSIVALVMDSPDAPTPAALPSSVPVVMPNALPPEIETVFLTPLRTLPRDQMRRQLPNTVTVIDAMVLVALAPQQLPLRGWSSASHNIYPIDLPQIRFDPDLDFLLLDCPARNLALMPNGLAYVHNALKKTAVRFQTFDLDIIAYHRFHITRLYDEGGTVVLPSGRALPEDPWLAEHYDLWTSQEVIDYFMPLMEEAAAAIVAARPRILGFSLQGAGEFFTKALALKVRESLPEVILVVGGYSCYNPDIGRRIFPECDYMCIGEADLTVGPLVESLARSEYPKNTPGILSRYDDPDWTFVPGPTLHNLDALDFPRYEWFGVDLYRNFNDYQLTPIIASRGCRWSRCTFCAERFFWRIRSSENFVNELTWMVDQGCSLFMFNESDLNGMPERLLDICDEIIRRGIKVKLTGQLRIHKKSDRTFFDKLRAAGFVALRFGVDAFSARTMRLQQKGYAPETVSQNLRDCTAAGIAAEINWVIGVPGETWDDVNEGIALLMENRRNFNRIANINPLILTNGSVYWMRPEDHNVHFRDDPEFVRKNYLRSVPADRWYSTEPYIDHNIRKQYYDHIIMELYDAGIPLGGWAQKVVNDVLLTRDKNRAGGTEVRVIQGKYRFIQDDGDYSIYEGRNKFLAAPKALEGFDPNAPDAERQPGVRVADSEKALLEALAEARRWANAHGHYDARDGNPHDHGFAEPEVSGERPDFYRFQEQWYAIQPSALTAALGATGGTPHRIDRAAWRRIKADETNTPAAHDGVVITSAIADGAFAECIQTVDQYDIILFDGFYWGVPHGFPLSLAEIWSSGLPWGKRVLEVSRKIKALTH